MQELLRHSTLRSTLDVYTQAITPAKHAAQAAVLSLVFHPKEMERHHRRLPMLQREESTRREQDGRKGTQKRARKRALLGPRWFRRSQCNSFGMNGGDDETRTRDLCRDRAAF